MGVMNLGALAGLGMDLEGFVGFGKRIAVDRFGAVRGER